MTKSREWLLLNAVEAWLGNYKDVAHPDTVKQYELLQSEFYEVYMATLVKDANAKDVVDDEPKPAPTRTRTRRTTKTKE